MSITIVTTIISWVSSGVTMANTILGWFGLTSSKSTNSTSQTPTTSEIIDKANELAAASGEASRIANSTISEGFKDVDEKLAAVQAALAAVPGDDANSVLQRDQLLRQYREDVLGDGNSGGAGA